MAGVTITLAMTLKPEVVDAFCAGLPESIKDTQQRPGFRSIQVVRNQEDPNHLLFVESWESEQDYHDYIAWRTERGDMDRMPDMLASAPKLDVWPSVVAAS